MRLLYFPFVGGVFRKALTFFVGMSIIVYVNTFTKGVFMPKIIENPEQRLLEEAKRQIEQSGYHAMTIRSVAKGCGVGVGTVYNYFPSKEALVASYILESWQKCMATVHSASQQSQLPAPVVRCIFDQLLLFAENHRMVFQDAAAESAFARSFSRYHELLRRQLADPIIKFCDSQFTAEFVAEALLTWTMAGKSFDEIYGILKKLMKSAVS